MDPLDFRSQCVAAKPCNTNQSGAHSESGPNPVWEEKNKDNPGPLEGGTSEQKLCPSSLFLRGWPVFPQSPPGLLYPPSGLTQRGWWPSAPRLGTGKGHTDVHVHTHVLMHMHSQTQAYRCIHTYIHVHTHAYTPTCTPVCTHTNLLMHTQSCICAYTQGFPDGSVVKNPPANAADTGDTGSIPLVGKILWRRKLQPTPVFLPGESHGQRSLEGYSPWGTRVGHTHRHTPQSTASQSVCYQRQPQEILRKADSQPLPQT